MSICLSELGLVCALGQSKQQVLTHLLDGNSEGLILENELPLSQGQYLGRVAMSESWQQTFIDKGITVRNNQLAYIAYQQIEAALTPLIKQFGGHRVAVVIGTSTAGILEGEQARKSLVDTGAYPDGYYYQIQEMAEPAHFIADLCQAKGPVYSISTACSSSGKALASARALLEADLADVVVAGGVDSLTRLTVNGFDSLESIAKGKCAPFSQNRDGINIGEAAALFVVSKDKQAQDGIYLLGVGESSDAHHMSAPAPDGAGAYQAMQQALDDAGIPGEQVDYVNLHGTGTIKNDEMEAKAMAKACGSEVLCGSTKGLTGHTLGAAGALEIGLCWLLLSEANHDNGIPENVAQGDIDEDLAKINLSKGQNVAQIRYCMSNSFAFGGNNFSAVLGKHLPGIKHE